MSRTSSPGDEAEQVVARFGILFVTESRVREQSRDGLKSAYLHEVNAVGTHRVHYPWLLAVAVLGAMVALFGGISGGREPAPLIGIGALIAFMALVTYALTRKVTLAVVAGAMTLSTTLSGANSPAGGGKEAVTGAEDFIESLEAAKHDWEGRRRGR